MTSDSTKLSTIVSTTSSVVKASAEIWRVSRKLLKSMWLSV